MRIRKLGTLLVTGVMALSLMGACSNAPAKDQAGSASESATSSLSGNVKAAGATAFQPLVQAAAQEFSAKNPNVTVDVQGGGSGTGLKQVSDKTVDIGNSDVFADEKLQPDQAKALVDHQVAISVMSPVVNAQLGVKNLTTDQLVSIFTGKAKNWKEVSGPDLPIVLITRPTSSGTRATFKKYALNGAEEANNQSQETDDSGTLIQKIQDNKGAIGYVALSYSAGNSKVASVGINGVEPTLENAYNGSYPVWTYEHMYTNGEPEGPTKAFLDYMLSDQFAPTVEKMGYGVASKLSDKAKASHTN
ncbi:MAG: phosphate ABC transporter substrate-binding protein [Actinomycetaceae bacterium]|nr:phosphate ABC transporter substrate-binding protein [Arcanobacterium sp.]MDD7686510.1 phosphate ABC transporter substrate-binding protein [Actinomycetaceae bacterium]MDY5272790.1 phosphate ABC transporter substrate-binding protein [Arcanobacterium sp.]